MQADGVYEGNNIEVREQPTYFFRTGFHFITIGPLKSQSVVKFLYKGRQDEELE
jgi:hypothetical protein